MFGYLVANLSLLSKEDRKKYRAYYCGLCSRINAGYGQRARRYLTYDLTFVDLLLADACHRESTTIEERCPLHLLRPHKAIINDLTDYCADMNIYLNYYKYLDDVIDNNSRKAVRNVEKLKDSLSAIEQRYPQVCKTIRDDLNYISQIEKDNILNPDLPSNAFGHLMGELLAVDNNDDLRQLGYHLGRFIYLMDAVIDLKDDIKKGNYNPLIALESSSFEEMLNMIMEDVEDAYQKIELSENKTIIDNIIYSGIWSRYIITNRKEAAK